MQLEPIPSARLPPPLRRPVAEVLFCGGYKRSYAVGLIYSDGRIHYHRDALGRVVRYAHFRTANEALQRAFPSYYRRPTP